MADFTLEQLDRRVQVTLRGDLTAALVPQLQASLRSALPTMDHLVVDLGQTEMLDSSGIGLLIAVSNSFAAPPRRLQVTNASADILQLLQSMRLAARLNASGRDGVRHG